MLGEVQKQTEKHPDAVSSLQDQLLTNIRNGITQKTNELIGALPNAGLKIVSAATNVIYVVIVPILAFFFLKDSVLIRSHLLSLADTSPAMRSFADGLMEDIHALLARYMRALVVLSLSTFTAYSTFFTIMDVPYGVLLAVLAMMLEFIPMIGPLVAGTAIVIVAAVAGSHVLAVLIFLLAFRMFQDYVLSPHIMGQGVELHPLLVLFGVFAGAEVAGVAGSFLSVPLLALIRILYLRMRRQRLATE
jgi:predicted PurR-regulated permease PerM